MAEMCKYEVLENLGFTSVPFKKFKQDTLDSSRVKKILNMAVGDRGMLSIVGERGIGKTTAIIEGLSGCSARVINVDPADRERLTIGDIEKEMVMALSDEKPRAGRVVRAKQLRRIVGEASRKNEIVLVIEEAHRLHGQTLRSIKTLREMEWMGERGLFTVVFVGQSDPMNKAGVAEVRLRSDSVQMQGLTGKEVSAYIQETIGSLFTDDAVILQIAEMGASRNFLELQELLFVLMRSAVAAGREYITRDDVTLASGQKVSQTPTRKKTDRAGQKAAVSAVLARQKNSGRLAADETSANVSQIAG